MIQITEETVNGYLSQEGLQVVELFEHKDNEVISEAEKKLLEEEKQLLNTLIKKKVSTRDKLSEKEYREVIRLSKKLSSPTIDGMLEKKILTVVKGKAKSSSIKGEEDCNKIKSVSLLKEGEIQIHSGQKYTRLKDGGHNTAGVSTFLFLLINNYYLDGIEIRIKGNTRYLIFEGDILIYKGKLYILGMYVDTNKRLKSFKYPINDPLQFNFLHVTT